MSKKGEIRGREGVVLCFVREKRRKKKHTTNLIILFVKGGKRRGDRKVYSH